MPAVKKFGLLIGSLLALAGSWQLYVTSHSVYLAATAAGVLMVAAGLVRPAWLNPAYRLWMTMALAVGWLMTRLILAVVYYAVVVPIGLVMQVTGRQLLQLNTQPDRNSYWAYVKTPGCGPEASNYEKQF